MTRPGPANVRPHRNRDGPAHIAAVFPTTERRVPARCWLWTMAILPAGHEPHRGLGPRSSSATPRKTAGPTCPRRPAVLIQVKLSFKETGRSRYITDAEFDKVKAHAHFTVIDAMDLALLTGHRPQPNPRNDGLHGLLELVATSGLAVLLVARLIRCQGKGLLFHRQCNASASVVVDLIQHCNRCIWVYWDAMVDDNYLGRLTTTMLAG